MLPIMSDLTGEKATEPSASIHERIGAVRRRTMARGGPRRGGPRRGGQGSPNMVVSDSAASRNWVVATALSFSASSGTLTKDCLNVSTMVPPGGMTGADMAAAAGEVDGVVGSARDGLDTRPRGGDGLEEGDAERGEGGERGEGKRGRGEESSRWWVRVGVRARRGGTSCSYSWRSSTGGAPGTRGMASIGGGWAEGGMYWYGTAPTGHDTGTGTGPQAPPTGAR